MARTLTRLTLTLGAALLLAACPRLPASPASPLSKPGDALEAAPATTVLWVSAGLRGALEPCGCSESLRGGLPRAATLLNRSRATGAQVHFLDAGNAYFGQATLDAAQRPQAEARARTLAGALRGLGLEAQVVGPLDLALGKDWLGDQQLPLLAPGRPWMSREGPLKVAAVTGSTRAELAQAAAAVRRDGARFVVALLPLDADEAGALQLGDSGVDLVVSAGPAQGAGPEENRLAIRGVPHVVLQDRGRSLLRVDLAAPGDGHFRWQRGEADVARELAALETRIALLERELDQPTGLSPELRGLKRAKRTELHRRRTELANAPPPAMERGGFTVRFVPVDASLPEDPAVARRLTEHDAEVGALNLAWAREYGEDCPPPVPGSAGYVGTATCLGCHPETEPVWKQSKHASAWETLEAKGKQHHLDCIGCHVVGWQQPGGVCRVDRVAGREDVGCESCHGPGSLHAAGGGSEELLAPVEARCRTCHDAEHSPHFDFATWVPRVLGPGHGQSRAVGRPPGP